MFVCLEADIGGLLRWSGHFQTRSGTSTTTHNFEMSSMSYIYGPISDAVYQQQAYGHDITMLMPYVIDILRYGYCASCKHDRLAWFVPNKS